jgi:hypothetical protein
LANHGFLSWPLKDEGGRLGFSLGEGQVTGTVVVPADSVPASLFLVIPRPPAWGTMTSFDPNPQSINLEGAITGSDATGTHGFIRNVSGAITTFDVPDGSSSVPHCTKPNPPVSLAVHLGAQIARCSDVAK